MGDQRRSRHSERHDEHDGKRNRPALIKRRNTEEDDENRQAVEHPRLSRRLALLGVARNGLLLDEHGTLVDAPKKMRPHEHPREECPFGVREDGPQRYGVR